MLEALIQPTTFFRALQERRPSLIVPLLIVMAAAVAAALGNVLLLRLLPTLIPGGLLLQVVFAVVGGVVLGILLIGLGGLIIHLLAGPESRAWEVYGWANVPALLLGLVMIPFQAMFPITGNLPPPVPPVTNPEALRAWQLAYQQVVVAAAETRILQVLGVLGTLWSIWIIWSGLRVLAPGRAVLSTLTVALVLLSFTLWGILAQA